MVEPAEQEPTRNRALGLGAVAVAVMVMAIASSIIKWADQPGSVVGFWRLVAASIAWWIVVGIRHRWRRAPLPTADTWRLVAPAGVFFGANIAVFFTVITKTSIAHAEFILSLSPLLLVPAGALFFAEMPNWRALRWGILSFTGLTIVLGFGPSEGTASVSGDLLMLVAVMCWVGYLLTTKRARVSVGVANFMACAMPVAALTCAPFALVLADDGLFGLSGRGWLVVCVLAVLTGMVGHGLIVVSQRLVNVATIGIVQVAQPAMAVVWGFILLGEEIAPAQVPGMILIVVALAAFTWVSQRPGRARTPASVESRASTGDSG